MLKTNTDASNGNETSLFPSSLENNGNTNKGNLIFSKTKMFHAKDVQIQALDWLRKQGYTIMAPEGVVSPAFPDSFVPSAFHTRVVKSVQLGTNGNEPQKAGCEWVYRHIDQGKVGYSRYHLSAFKMLVFFGVYSRIQDDRDLRQEVIKTVAGLLERFGLNIKRCFITYFGGGNILGRELEPDNEIFNLWCNIGVPKEQLIPISGGANFTNLTRSGEPAGPRCEIFWQMMDNSFIELGTVVFERFLLNLRDNKLDESKGLVYGAAFGLERLLMVSSGCKEIFEIPELKQLIAVINEKIDSRLAGINYETVLSLVDGVRALTILWDNTDGQFKGRRLERIRSLWRSIKRNCQSLGIKLDEKFVSELASIVLTEESETNESKAIKFERFIFSLENNT